MAHALVPTIETIKGGGLQLRRVGAGSLVGHAEHSSGVVGELGPDLVLEVLLPV